MMNDDKRQGAVEAAMLLFWEQGAEGASYNDIVAATGLSRKALYAEWPDKETLVHDALQHYRNVVLGQLIAPLETGGRAGLEAFWDQLQTEIRAAKKWTGCFLFRSVSGPLRSDTFVASAYDEYAGRMRELVARCVRDGQAKGVIGKQTDAEAAGWHALGKGLLHTCSKTMLHVRVAALAPRRDAPSKPVCK